ncbi:HGGxSTG domain-containing protein [Rhodococcus ruber]|uniref:HGGxSTG domain-containing protein n=1 Tax=Rhodococcus ruber TaxID=1830 RepID=A0ABT4MIC0_9NOCA|nr:HGGxSTG domain-containing protein [Rhodococcus ruber]MCZ4520723.1 HGGxSTG domain-containing protein [Rhodococcus ruber]
MASGQPFQAINSHKWRSTVTTNREAEIDSETVSTDRIARHYNRNPDRPSCSARSRRTGDPCNNPPMHGTTVCRMHGGSAPQVKAAARVRIERAADRMAKELLGIAVDETTPPAVRLAAIRDALDRSGLGAKTAVEVSVGPKQPWEIVFEDLAGGSRAESRAARGFAGDDPLVLEAEVVDSDGVGAAGMLDGVGSGTAAPAPNGAPPPQQHSPGAAGNTGSATGSGGGNWHGYAASTTLRRSERHSHCEPR